MVLTEAIQTVRKLFLIQEREKVKLCPNGGNIDTFQNIRIERKFAPKKFARGAESFSEKDVTKTAPGTFGKSEHVPATKCRGNASEGTKGIASFSL